MTDVILDTSAVLAVFNQEPGMEQVVAVRNSSFISAVNFAEVITKFIEEGMPPEQAVHTAQRFGCKIVEADENRAALAGMMHVRTRRTGVSLGDRFCLALAQEMHLPVLTTDRRWKDLDLGVEITLIR